jgi:hypothetical protein
MSVYVRLGIRLLYKGLKSRRMEKDKSKSSQSASRIDVLEIRVSHRYYHQTARASR